jgi:CBS domain-containing protein
MIDQPARGSEEDRSPEPLAEESPQRPMPPWNVVFTRGSATSDIATMLSGGAPIRVEGDLRAATMDARADMLVTKKLTSFDLVSAVVPNKVDPEKVSGVAAAVGTGPNSRLAAAVTHRIAGYLGVPGRLITAPAPGAGEASARELLDDLARETPGLARSVLPPGSNAASIVEGLEPDTLLVLGEPGGSWLHRQFFGPGRKLIHDAPTGALIVRAAPPRCFRFVGDPDYVGAGMRAGDAVKVFVSRVVPVVEERQLVGIARRSALLTSEVDRPVADLMEPPVALDQDDLLDAAWALAAFFEGAPIPVVDPDGALVGTIDPRRIGIGPAE